ncbi:MAG TPA: pantoate--beta-alanine ligase [Thermoanaerobaculia bacterium]|nr:pantoate--beta-alanine ligase [Thermoanaerobaculia bacterium]
MIEVSALEPLRAAVRQAREAGRSIGFVPTMGALHEGHLSLVRRSRRECGFTAVSIFVNPLQFGPQEDFARYPRRPREDAALLEREGVDLLYAPDAAAFYPRDFSTSLAVAEVSDGGEGAVRPGHFQGVATVVAKLLHQVAPDVAYFGRKDLQQTAVIRRMVRDLDFPVRVALGETVRDPDGLALSSRNAYLSAEERRLAVSLPRALLAARGRAAAGEKGAHALARQTREDLEGAGLAVDYVEVVDAETMRPLDRVEAGAAIAAAVRLGKTRLIDNVLLLEER